MINKELLENINRLGFPLMEITNTFDANKTLSEVVKSKEIRLWEGFPVLLANSAIQAQFDYMNVLKKLKKKEDKENFNNLVLTSLALYDYKHLSFNWAKQLKDEVTKLDKTKFKKFRDYLVHNRSIVIANKQITTERLLNTFNNYFEQDAKETQKIKEKYEELSLAYSLSQIFSPKQKELFKKKLNGDSLTKTEKEYYSRTVKKKVLALANSELHHLSQKLMEH